MAIYFPNQVPSTGQKAGESFASGIGNVLNMLAQQKLSHVQQRQQQGRTGSALESLGIPSQVGILPEKIQQEFIKQHLAQPQQQAFAKALSNLLGNEQQQTAPALESQDLSPAPSTNQPQQQKPSTTAIPKGLNQQQATQLAQIALSKQNREQQEQHFQQNLGFKKGEVRRKFIDQMVQEKKGTEDRMQAIKVMEKLNNDPNALDSPTYLRALKAFGLDNIGDLLKPGTQQFKAAEVAFLTNLKNIFGARPTNFDVMTYLAKLPNLMQSPEGRRRVIDNWKNLLEASEIRYNVTRDILKAHPHGLPEDINIMIEDKAGPLIDEKIKKFEEEANAIASGKTSFQAGQTITKDQLSSLPAGTVLEENGKKFRWDGSKKKAL